MERDGIPKPGGVTVSPGKQLTGLRAVLVYGISVVRGRVTLQGGTLPAGTNLFVIARMITSGPTGPDGFGMTDARGRFEIKGLSYGQYQIEIDWNGPSKGPNKSKRLQLAADRRLRQTWSLI